MRKGFLFLPEQKKTYLKFTNCVNSKKAKKGAQKKNIYAVKHYIFTLFYVLQGQKGQIEKHNLNFTFYANPMV